MPVCPTPGRAFCRERRGLPRGSIEVTFPRRIDLNTLPAAHHHGSVGKKPTSGFPMGALSVVGLAPPNRGNPGPGRHHAAVVLRHRRGKHLSSVEEHFRTVCTCLPAGIFATDSAGTCVYANARGAVKDTYNLLDTGIRQLCRAWATHDGEPVEVWAGRHDFSGYFASSLKGSAGIDWSDEAARNAF